MLLVFIDRITPVLAFIFINPIIIVGFSPFIKVSLILEGLFFSALFAAELITLAGSNENLTTDLTLTEAELPVRHSVHVVGYYWIVYLRVQGAENFNKY